MINLLLTVHNGHIRSNTQTYHHSNDHVSLYALLELIKTSFVNSNPYNYLSDGQFPRSLRYSARLVLLTTGHNLTFTKKSKQVNKFLDESHDLTNFIADQGEC